MYKLEVETDGKKVTNVLHVDIPSPNGEMLTDWTSQRRRRRAGMKLEVKPLQSPLIREIEKNRTQNKAK